MLLSNVLNYQVRLIGAGRKMTRVLGSLFGGLFLKLRLHVGSSSGADVRHNAKDGVIVTKVA